MPPPPKPFAGQTMQMPLEHLLTAYITVNKAKGSDTFEGVDLARCMVRQTAAGYGVFEDSSYNIVGQWWVVGGTMHVTLEKDA